ncbi:MAG: peptidoglycan D,D-transpeptidase FtsI family protein [Solirubrobacterales bacterium]
MIERRIGLLFACFLLLLCLAIGRAAWVQGVQGAGLSADASSQHTQTIMVPGQRGSILDRQGRELAVSEDAADVVATPYQVKHPSAAASRLSSALPVSRADIYKALSDRSSGFAYVARGVDLKSADRVRKLGIGGIATVPATRRLYPEGKLATQVIGTVGTDGQGLTGLEASDNGLLGAASGQRAVTVDGLGNEIQRSTISPAQHGEDLKLTIDAQIQAKTEQVLAGIGAAYQPKDATAIVMDPRSSQVLAMADWPAVNPTDPGSANPRDLQNMATGFTYEPGSTFKAFTVAGALQQHMVTPSTVFQLPTALHVADRTITDAEARGPVSLTVAQILAQSSNVGAVKIGLGLGAQHFYDWVRRFGFAVPTGIQFPGEERGIVPTPSQFSGSTMGNLPMGQGLSVTPIQMAAAYSAIADGGILRPPQLVLDQGGARVAEPPGHRVISSTNAAKLRQMLEGVLAPGGTASEVSIPGYTLAGKTGTAQVAIKGGYSTTKFIASFVGFAPANNPRLLVAVVVNDPKGGNYYGGTVAAPAFRDIANFALPYLEIPPDQP